MAKNVKVVVNLNPCSEERDSFIAGELLEQVISSLLLLTEKLDKLMSANEDLKLRLEQMAIIEANQSAQLTELTDWIKSRVEEDLVKTAQLEQALKSLDEQTALITQLQNELSSNMVPANLVNLANLVQSSQTDQSAIITALLDMKNPPAPVEPVVGPVDTIDPLDPDLGDLVNE